MNQTPHEPGATAAQLPGAAGSPAPAGALIPLGDDAAAVKESAALARAETTRQIAAVQASIGAAKAELEERRRAAEVAYRQQLAELEAAMAPMKAQLAKLVEVCWSVDLYLGRDEQIELLIDGAPAPADTPITLRQMVLAMDEESLVLLEDGGLDGRDVSAFFSWLTASPQNRDRIIPDAKGVVVLVPSRQRRDYGDTFTNAAVAAANKSAYWLIRNGERLYLLTTDENLEVGDRLLPTRSEFLDFFYTRPSLGGERVPLEPGSDAWLRAQDSADQRRRHYMRIMLVLQGLIDRSVAFHPLPDGGVNLLSVAAQDSGKVVIINELDNVLTSGREPFRTWQRRLNAQLRPGMRVIADFGREFRDLHEHREEAYRPAYNDRITPRGASYPASLVPHLIEERATRGQLVIRYQRTDEVWSDRWVPDPLNPGYERRLGAHVPKQRATCRLHPDDSFVLPYDLVTVEELRTYLGARSERRSYLTMVPVLKAALAAKEAEAAAEAPFRRLLAQLIVTEHDADPAEVEAQLPSLVDWWKLTNRWARPLVADPADEAKAAAAIRAEWAARQAEAKGAGARSERDAAMVVAARRIPGVIAIAARRDGRYEAYSPAGPGQDVYLNVTALRADGTPGKVKEWVQIPARTRAALRILWSDRAWETWQHQASRSEHLTGPEQEQIVATLREAAAAVGTPIAVTYTAASGCVERCFEVFTWSASAGTPGEDASAIDQACGSDPFGQARDVNDLMASFTMTWRRGPGGVLVTEGPERDRAAHWTRYSGHGPGRHDAPWRPVDSPYRRKGEAALIWADERMLEQVEQARAAIRKQRNERNAALDARRARVSLVVDQLRADWLAARTATERTRFMEDFGAAEDLWEHHLATLKLETHWQVPDRLRDVVQALLDAGTDLAGLTVSEAFAQAAALGVTSRRSLDEDVARLTLTQPAE